MSGEIFDPYWNLFEGGVVCNMYMPTAFEPDKIPITLSISPQTEFGRFEEFSGARQEEAGNLRRHGEQHGKFRARLSDVSRGLR